MIPVFITQQGYFLKKAYQPSLPMASESYDDESQGFTKEEHQDNKENNEQPIVTPAPEAEESPVTPPIKEQQPSKSLPKEEPNNNQDVGTISFSLFVWKGSFSIIPHLSNQW